MAYKSLEERREYRRKYAERNKARLKEYRAEYYQKNKDNIKAQQGAYKSQSREHLRLKAREYYNQCKDEDSPANWLRKCLHTSRRNGVAVDPAIDLKYLLELWARQDGKCAITGMPLLCKRHDLRSASIDRIDSSVHYACDNIHLVCKWVNFAKNKASLVDFQHILDEYVALRGSNGSQG